MREAVPPERLLVLRTAKDGWAPLCKFLRRTEPEGPYPRTNDTREMLDKIKTSRRICWACYLGIPVAVLLIGGGIAAGRLGVRQSFNYLARTLEY